MLCRPQAQQLMSRTLHLYRYGTVPVVRKTGGLNDTVFDVDDDHERAAAAGYVPNGFSFEGMDAAGIDYALNRSQHLPHNFAVLAFRRAELMPDRWPGYGASCTCSSASVDAARCRVGMSTVLEFMSGGCTSRAVLVLTAGRCPCGTRTARRGRHWRVVSWSRHAASRSPCAKAVKVSSLERSNGMHDNRTPSRWHVITKHMDLNPSLLARGVARAEHVSTDKSSVAMQDWSWDAPALDYIDLYFRALK